MLDQETQGGIEEAPTIQKSGRRSPDKDNEGRARFNAIKRAVPGISPKTLTQCLRQLERNGLLEHRVLTESPLGVEYSFTKLGDTLETPVAALYEWTNTYSSAVSAAQARYDAKILAKASRSTGARERRKS